MIDFADLKQIDIAGGLPDQFQRLSRVNDRLQTGPRRQTLFFRFFNGADTILRACCSRFPFGAIRWIDECQRSSKPVVNREQVEITGCPAAALGKNFDVEVVTMQNFNSLAGERMDRVNGLVRVSGKTEQHRPLTAELLGVFSELCQHIRAGVRFAVKKLTGFEYGARRITVQTAVTTTCVQVRRKKRRILGLCLLVRK